MKELRGKKLAPKKTRKELQEGFQPKEPSELQFLRDGIHIANMGIREEVMKYFKGDCVSKLMEDSEVRIRKLGFAGGPNGENYVYLRRQHANSKPTQLFFGGEVISLMEQAEDAMTFYPGILNRSLEYRELYESIRGFFGKYLQGVELKEDTEAHFNEATNGSNDRQRLVDIGKRNYSKGPMVEEVPMMGGGYQYVHLDETSTIDYAQFLQERGVFRTQRGEGIVRPTLVGPDDFPQMF